MAGVGVEGVVKKFGDHAVLHAVDITVEDGAFVILVGPSGCGKSTLLRSIAGLESISGGRITIGDKDVSKAPPKDRDIAMVFQNYALYPHMTVAENMGFSLKLARTPRAEADERIRRAAEILGLSALLGRYPKQLSGGQRQRVAMGRAIVRDPKVFLFDEPLSNLDAKLRVQMRLEIKELHQKLGTTIIYVTHDQVEAMTMADKIVVMREGRVEQIGAPLELYDRPANLFVASFIGSPAMNLVKGRVDEAGFAVSASGARFPLPKQAGAKPGAEVVLGVRPEHLLPRADGIAAEIVAVEPMGSETQLYLRVGVDSIALTSRERIDAAPGSQFPVGYAPESAHVFDAATGKRL